MVFKLPTPRVSTRHKKRYTSIYSKNQYICMNLSLLDGIITNYHFWYSSQVVKPELSFNNNAIYNTSIYNALFPYFAFKNWQFVLQFVGGTWTPLQNQGLFIPMPSMATRTTLTTPSANGPYRHPRGWGSVSSLPCLTLRMEEMGVGKDSHYMLLIIKEECWTNHFLTCLLFVQIWRCWIVWWCQRGL